MPTYITFLHRISLSLFLVASQVLAILFQRGNFTTNFENKSSFGHLDFAGNFFESNNGPLAVGYGAWSGPGEAVG